METHSLKGHADRLVGAGDDIVEGDDRIIEVINGLGGDFLAQQRGEFKSKGEVGVQEELPRGFPPDMKGDIGGMFEFLRGGRRGIFQRDVSEDCPCSEKGRLP